VHSDKSRELAAGDDGAEPAEESQQHTLEWLLDMDLSDPEERLFTVDRAQSTDTGLTDYELQVARRPMVRGCAGADDLANYVDEEIVISSDTQSSDIYASSSPDPDRSKRPDSDEEEPMAVDYSRDPDSTDITTGAEVQEGIDILGLAEDDDMGEKFLVIKRVKPVAHPEEAAARTTVPAEKEQAASTAAPTGVNAQDETGTGPVPDPADQPPAVLSEGPVLRLVSAGQPLSGANDDLPADDADQPGAAETAEPATASAEDVFDYIAAAPPPESDEAFDEYLLGGGQLPDGDPSFNELALVPLEDETVAESDEHIEYHEDFQRLRHRAGGAVSRVTPVLPEVAAELALVINERLASLGMPAGSVRADIMLGSEPATADALAADGFEPVIAVCATPLVALQQLRQVDVDSIYVRLVNVDSGEHCNTLFEDDFNNPAVGRDQSIEDELDDTFSGFGQLDTTDFSDSSQADASEQSPVEDEDTLQVFGEDIFADDLVAAAEQGESGLQTDIDALFDGLGTIVDEPDDICGLAEDEYPAGDFPGEDPAVDFALPADFPESAEPAETAEAAALPAGEEAAGEVEAVAVTVAAEIAEVAEAAEDTEFDRSVEVTDPAPGPSAESAEFNCIPADIVFSEASPGGGEIFADFLDAFIEEGSSELEKLEDAVAAWERDAGSEPAFAVVSRILHTVKGIAKGVGLHFYGTLIHNFETLLGALPRPQAGSEGEYFRVVNAWLDACVRGLDHIQEARADITTVLPQVATRGAEQAATDIAGEEAAPTTAAADPLPASPIPSAPRVEAAATAPVNAREMSKKIADDGARALAAQQSVRITSEKLDHLLNLSNQAQQLSVRTAQSVTRGKRASFEMQTRLASVRAHIAGIADRALRSVAARGVQPGAPMDALEMDQYSELQEAANILREGVEDLADLVDFATRQNTQIEALLKQQTNVISSIGSSIRAARVVPVSRLVPGLRRLVRTVSVDLNKTVSFKVLNEIGSLDRDDFARCQTILDHMVRNALDHGIESAEEREAAAKPADGLVTIDIRKAGADTVITLADDGRGIDPAKMRESAVRKGLDVDVDALTDTEAARLIFHKGFSTAAAVSQISGRGVGMDIVLSELQEMGGDIQIDSVPGRGTAFHIRVPSSITVNGALLVSAGEQSYAIPLGALIALEQVPVAEFFAAVQERTQLQLGGLACEPAYLATLCHTGHCLDAKTWKSHVPVIVAGSPERYMAIAVDDVEEALELVIRSLGTQFSSVPGVAGAATTAAGEAIVALDLNLLVASVSPDDRSTLHVDAERDENLLVMVVDDSRTQRMVATSQLETLGVETMTAENGSVAIDLLNAADRLPDIILMDVEMPVKDGIQALREVRKSVRYGHIPVIMITSRTGLKHRAMAQAAGCNGYMGKPFNFRMLVGQINELTGQRLELS